MKAFVYKSHGDASVMHLAADVPIPEMSLLGDHAVRIKVHAASLNPIDYKRRNGDLKAIKAEKKFPVVLGYDAAGIVDSVGTKVTSLKVGDAVYTRIAGKEDSIGTLAEYTLTTEDKVAIKPRSLSFEEAAAIPLAAVTALQMLRKAGFKAGDSVFINAAAGGVGHFAGQIAKALGK
jgi:NADPH:quinone reductase-like Zn-dependent oxidoreductase